MQQVSHADMTGLLTLRLLPLLALASLFIKINGSSSLDPVLTGPDKAYLGSRAVFRCRAPGSSPPVSYQLLSDGGAVMASYVDLQGDQPASFGMKVLESSNGSYYCRATAGGITGTSSGRQLSVVIPASQTTVTSDPSPAVLYEGSRLVLSCDVGRGSHLSFSWFFNRKAVTPSAFPPDAFNFTGNKLAVEEVTPEHAGSYSCMAWSAVQDVKRFSSSADVQVVVKVYLSEPEISFSVFQEGDRCRGNVTCWSPRGSPPVNFSLVLDDVELGSVTATDSLVGWFLVDVVPGLDVGVARCGARTERQELKSRPLTLAVVPVGGDVSVKVEYLYTSGSKPAASLLTCQVSRGTFPLISWLLNDSALPSGSGGDRHPRPTLPHSALADGGRTLVLARLGPEELGFYRCRARDSYNRSAPWVESRAELVQVTEASLSATELISIAFCCFLLLMLVLCSACVFKMFDRGRGV